MKYSFDLNLGEGLCIFTSFHFPDSGLCLSKGFEFILIHFEWHDSKNQQYGEVPSERGIFFRLQVYERVGILLVEVCKRDWEICHFGL